VSDEGFGVCSFISSGAQAQVTRLVRLETNRLALQERPARF
jgi:hypothetical protein